jgi:hypothetical protein
MPEGDIEAQITVVTPVCDDAFQRSESAVQGLQHVSSERTVNLCKLFLDSEHCVRWCVMPLCKFPECTIRQVVPLPGVYKTSTHSASCPRADNTP